MSSTWCSFLVDLSVTLRKAEPSDDQFLWECLASLRGNAHYSVAQLGQFLRFHSGTTCEILLAEFGGASVGMLTCNRTPMPRYLGVGVELEEVVIHPGHQGRGLALPMIRSCVNRYLADPDVRRITVHSDDQGRAKRMYSKLFATSDMKRYVIRGTSL
jgi:ribosomal protein S18 acetylase RimI-like enzyme